MNQIFNSKLKKGESKTKERRKIEEIKIEFGETENNQQ